MVVVVPEEVLEEEVTWSGDRVRVRVRVMNRDWVGYKLTLVWVW